MSESLPLWDRCLNDLRYQLKENEFTMWLRPLSAKVVGDKLELLAPNQYFVTHVQENHFAAIEQLAKQHSNGEISQVVIKVESSVQPASQDSTVDRNTSNGHHNRGSASMIQGLDSEGNLSDAAQMASDKSLSYINPYFTFETFVSGKSNMLAYKACQELGKKQSQNRHNPLFLYGASGLGKTHLMHSVAHKYLKIGKTFYYFSSEKFINQLVYALRNQKIEQFKRKIKRVDLLIIDDVHVLAGKNKSSSEFLSLFADFMVEGKQVILASDRHPSQMTEFDERFRSRFSSGLAVSIEPPEMETRMQILQKKASLSGVELPKECALFIAQNVVSNVRRLEGALNQVVANANLTGNPIDLDMVQYALKDVIAIRSQAVSMDNIRKVVAEYYDVSVKDLMSKKRTRSIARPRQIAMALARELTKDSFPDIGQSFGGRDHTTVMHACDKVAQLRSEDPVLDKEYKALSMTLQAG
ncbi:chromosomal replication initiator protein DnaA [Psychrobacter sanguinis]|uniref:chromosomal replication initiator protein DnaA n=1 Tax=Psychrobacter sanguinis TaxID=861445 RepID=UPI00191B7640|nr:chromosomal replication initiator protein DnaA [Psychrobacter sanguinis]MCC3345706.1 chromosomal replication initiator protein DnaA [Psychrobacter sanguinis]